MDQPSLEAILADLNFPAIHFYSTIDSTNAEAGRWIDRGSPHLSLFVADEQTAGRGRAGRHWITSPGTGLALSLVLLSPPLDPQYISRLAGLGAIAVQNTLSERYALSAQVKWPNDVLLEGRKVAGVLAETRWNGETFQSAVLGIGINIASGSVSMETLPAAGLDFPATCIEMVTGKTINRLEFIHEILRELLAWLPRLSLPDFITAWESALAFRGQWIELVSGITSSLRGDEGVADVPLQGKEVGLTNDGSLILQTSSGELVVATTGDLHLRPMHLPITNAG